MRILITCAEVRTGLQKPGTAGTGGSSHFWILAATFGPATSFDPAPVKASHSHMQDAASHSQSLAKVTATFFYSVLHLSSFGFLNVFLDLL
ncbi:MAG: hypothetical protein GY823_10645 [Flavobacteriaceae bacterium]|nr:hypothetical protein [Flavobacteriaceae bacterium]